ncbi:MAG TPA: Rne/Rng family ribonuclease [Candidatus Sulfotelmatobacter sp.]|jgi:ribonuclease E|nr:Rne/Rng family ribonuclease [Candidatus Sulfotelmatobacter sp.]
MAKRMLIDATHAEETRVVVVNGTRLEEFDVETSTKKQLKGNIYLAKIVRVEPSLQAAFVDYGGNRHGFLAFSEIHPDYYQIPVADRQALLAEQREVMKQSATAASADFGDNDDHDDHSDAEAAPAPLEAAGGAQPAEQADGENQIVPYSDGQPQPVVEILPPDAPIGDHHVETLGGDDEEGERRRPKSLRNYKIQEVIKRRQIVLVQVVKEERGNKGAALTTYLSLAGRYCVLMPNTARGGGVSRKITNATDRKRLKAIANEMEIPDGMAVIVRTAGSERTKPEIRRDYEYLLRLWDSVRSLTLQSTAPALVYEEANLIKRSIRDLYSRDIDDILVDGEEGYRLAKDFMRMLTPSHAKKVQLYKDPTMPLFQRFQIESQLDAMHSAVVQLRSGGYLVINQTEALVAIDVNSGRSTKERHIEETALKTNLEAADEVARQLRLRDLAGLIVIDFIDMEETRNNHAVERRLKEAMRFDRARIQLGKISPFGLLELSRQRLRPSLMETSFQPCPHCGGTGMVRSVESSSVHVLRAIEEEGIRRRSSEVTVTVHPSIALYILNQKRDALSDIEARYGFRVFLLGDDSLIPPAFRMDKVKSETPIELPVTRPINGDLPIVHDPEDDEVVEEESETVEEEDGASPAAPAGTKDEDAEGRGRRRRRRRRRGRRDDSSEALSDDDSAEDGAEGDDAAEGEESQDGESQDAEAQDGEDSDEDGVLGEASARRRRRGKRGGRRRNRGRDAAALPPIGEGDAAAGESEAPAAPTDVMAEAPEAAAAADALAAEEVPAKPKRVRAPRKKKVEEAPAAEEAKAEETPTEKAADEEVPAKPKRVRAPRKKKVEETPAAEETKAEETRAPVVDAVKAEPVPAPAPVTESTSEPVAEAAPEPAPVPPPAPAPEPQAEQPASPPRKGWWNRFL